VFVVEKGSSSLLRHGIIGNLHIICVFFLQQENLEFQGSKIEHDDHVVEPNLMIEGLCITILNRKWLHLGVQEFWEHNAPFILSHSYIMNNVS
jgi:hypothetical protein